MNIKNQVIPIESYTNDDLTAFARSLGKFPKVYAREFHIILSSHFLDNFQKDNLIKQYTLDHPAPLEDKPAE